MSIRRSSSVSTARLWSDFRRWCAAKGLKALPAHPWTIAAYLRVVDRRAKGEDGARAAKRALDVIAREHVLKTARVPTRHPTVQKTLELIERRTAVRAQHAALFDVADILAETPPTAPDGVGEPEADEDQDSGDQDQRGRTRRMLGSRPKLKRARPGRKTSNSKR